MCSEFLTFYTKYESDLYLYTRNHQNGRLNLIFSTKSNFHKGYLFNLCSCVVNSLLYSQCEMFILKISGIQKHFFHVSFKWITFGLHSEGLSEVDCAELFVTGIIFTDWDLFIYKNKLFTFRNDYDLQ